MFKYNVVLTYYLRRNGEKDKPFHRCTFFIEDDENFERELMTQAGIYILENLHHVVDLDVEKVYFDYERIEGMNSQ